MSSTTGVGASNSAYAANVSRKVERLISRADQNGDGQVSLPEFDSIGQNLPGGAASSAASNTGASASATQAATDRSALFGQIDTNGDGQLGADELSAYDRQQVTAARGALLNLQEVFGGGSAGGETGGVGHARRGHHHYAARAAAADGDATSGQKDATASPSGASTDPVDAFFSAVDADGSGSISKAELASFVTQMFSRGRTSTQAGTATATTTTAATSG